MRGENGVRRHDGRDLREQLAAEHHALRCQAAPLVIAQSEALTAELLFQQPVLLSEVIDHVALMLVQPAGQKGENKLKGLQGHRGNRRRGQR
jgi:hypothetical protein